MLGQGRIREGLAWLDAALADQAPTADSDAAAARVRALADKAFLDAWYGSLNPPDVEDVEAALAIARRSEDPALLIRALVARGCVVLYDANAAAPYFAEAAVLARELEDARLLSQMIERQSYAAMIVNGDIDGTISMATEGRGLALTTGDHLISLQCGIYTASALLMRGELGSGIAMLRTVAAEARAARDVLCTLTALMAESIGLAFQGDTRGAQIAIATALEGASEVGEYFESACHPNVALVYLASGDVSAAWEAGQRALPTITNQYNLGNCNWVVYAALAAGQLYDSEPRRGNGRFPGKRLLVGHGTHCACPRQDRGRRIAISRRRSALSSRRSRRERQPLERAGCS